MSDERHEDREHDPAAPEVHDDIMKRLTAYQRELRGGAEPTEAAATAWAQRLPAPDVGPPQPAGPDPLTPVDPEPVRTAASEPTPIQGEPTATDPVAAVPDEAATVAEPEVVDLSTAPESEPAIAPPAPPARSEEADRVEVIRSEPVVDHGVRIAPVGGRETTRTDVSERIEQLERTLDRLGNLVDDLRGRFQNMAVAAGERIAAIQAEIERERRGDPGEPGSGARADPDGS